MYYLQSRYYDPNLGRFINGDNYPTTGQGFTGNNMYAYCGNNPIIRVDTSGEFFNTIFGGIVGGIVAVITRKPSEPAGKAFVRGLVTGAVAGAAIDICVATGGVAGLVIAGTVGAAASVADTMWEAHNNGEKASAGDLIVSGIVGGGLNVLFGAAGYVPGRATGNTVKSIGKAIITNSVSGVTKSGKVVAKKVASTFVENIASSSMQSGFGKAFSLIGSTMLEGLG